MAAPVFGSGAAKGLGALQQAQDKALADSKNAESQTTDTPSGDNNGATANQAENPQKNETQPLSADPDPVVGNESSKSAFDRATRIYTCAPIQRQKIGRFQFDRATLTLTSDEDVEEFEKILEKLPEYERNRIKTISVKAAEEMVRPIEPGVTQQFDSSVGRHREKSATGDPIVGENDLANPQTFSKQAQTDNNIPVDGQNVIPPGASQTESKN